MLQSQNSEMSAPCWDLASILKAPFEEIVQNILRKFNQFHLFLEKEDSLKKAILLFQEIGKEIKELDSFVYCLLAEDTFNQESRQKQGVVTTLNSKWETASLMLGKKLAQHKKQIFTDPELKEITFFLNEILELSEKKLNLREEKLINDLSVDGYHSYWQLYRTVIAQARIKVQGKEYSLGQTEHFFDHRDRKIRKEAFEGITGFCNSQAEIFSSLLNHLAGFRLQVYEHRGWEDFLFEPLMQNRMSKKTLFAIWQAVDESKALFIEYFRRKAKLLGIQKLSWYDLNVLIGEEQKSQLNFEMGANFVIQQLQNFHPKMAEFARSAIEQQWVEAENRSGKQAGAFCVSFPMASQSRVFMTYCDTMYSITTLAHELGHAYHAQVLFDQPFLNQIYRMNVAESASTFAEMVVIDSALKNCSSPQEKLLFLDDKIQRVINYLMNIHARFIFETAFYEERKKGIVSAEKLCSLMEHAQKSSYRNSLDQWHPYFWASKLHFYFSDTPFYNFPYTFGFIFSLAIYMRMKANKQSADKYDALLRDTARMSSEELAKKHLQADIEDPSFWRETIQFLAKDVEEFLSLAF